MLLWLEDKYILRREGSFSKYLKSKQHYKALYYVIIWREVVFLFELDLVWEQEGCS